MVLCGVVHETEEAVNSHRFRSSQTVFYGTRTVYCRFIFQIQEVPISNLALIFTTLRFHLILCRKILAYTAFSKRHGAVSRPRHLRT
jgi:hypothetical protein